MPVDLPEDRDRAVRLLVVTDKMPLDQVLRGDRVVAQQQDQGAIGRARAEVPARADARAGSLDQARAVEEVLLVLRRVGENDDLEAFHRLAAERLQGPL